MPVFIFIFSLIFKCSVSVNKIFLYLLNSLSKTLKNTGKWKKNLEKSGKFVSQKVWEPWEGSTGNANVPEIQWLDGVSGCVLVPD